MARIRSRDTAPELSVRRHLHKAGLRFRLYQPGLPGKPDLVFPSRRVCVFVHGCFWHGCPRCVDGTRRVKSNETYWLPKIAGNKVRDERHRVALHAAGWTVITIWACEAVEEEHLDALAWRIRALPGRAAKSTESEVEGST